VIGWTILLVFADIIVISIVGMVAILSGAKPAGANAMLLLLRQHPYLVLGANMANYLVLVLCIGVIARIYLVRGVWERVVTSTTVHNLAPRGCGCRARWQARWARVLAIVSTSPDSKAVSDISGSGVVAVSGAAPRPAVYFDGVTNRRHIVDLGFGADLSLLEGGVTVASWRYDDLCAVDGARGTLRVKNISGLPLARLDIFDPSAQAEIAARARYLQTGRGGGHAHTGRIVAWSLAAIGSIFLVVVYGMPLVANRLTPLIPLSFDRHLGAMADNQVRLIFGGRTCTNAEGRAAFSKLVETVRQASHLDVPLQTEVLTSSVPNAFALPGGKIYLLNGLLQKPKAQTNLPASSPMKWGTSAIATTPA
jgi:hypothetical protein